MTDSPFSSPGSKRFRKMETSKRGEELPQVGSETGNSDNIRLERDTNITPVPSSQSSTSASSDVQILEAVPRRITRDGVSSRSQSPNRRFQDAREEQMDLYYPNGFARLPMIIEPDTNSSGGSGGSNDSPIGSVEFPSDFSSSSSDDDDDDDDEEDDDDDDDDGVDNRRRLGDMIYDYDDEDDDLEYFSDQSDDTIEHVMPDEYLSHDPTPNTQYPRPDWITVKELLHRKTGFASTKLPRQTNTFWFEKHASNSLWMIQRLELSRRLEEHRGSVNCLDFNKSGSLLCSGSDDRKVCVWDWQSKKLVRKLDTRHERNILCCSFADRDEHIVTSSRDGRVCMVDVETGQPRILLTEAGEEIGQFAFLSPQTLVACGTSAKVRHIDLRSNQHEQLFQVRSPTNETYSVSLYTISSHPIDKHQLITAGVSPYVFLYDLRFPDRFRSPLAHCICPEENRDNIITSTEYSDKGDKFLVSYNDGDLFACKSNNCDMIHRYTGHMNKKTIKGCAWFGDNFVLSGSDDGHIYGWDLESEHIVCFLEGDIKGVVNSLVVHPRLPVLASSGLDHNVKVWEPISKEWPQTLKGIKPQICMNALRRKRKRSCRAMSGLRSILLIDDVNDDDGDGSSGNSNQEEQIDEDDI